MKIAFQFNDGGRAASGYQGTTGDCVTRAIAIATGLPYQQVYDAMANGNAGSRITRKRTSCCGKRSARNGVAVKRKWFTEWMTSIGWKWTPCMNIGSGCQVHLRADELPTGKLIVAVSKHYTAVIDGVLNDIYDCSREGTRCVYGYWSKA